MKTARCRLVSNLLRRVALGLILTLFLASALPSTAQASGPQERLPPDMLVGEVEAVRMADLWFAMELNRIGGEMDAFALAERFNRMSARQVLYLVAGNKLVDKAQSGDRILAYVVKYVPTGYVVVSGSDRIEPIVAFSAESEFRWDPSETNFLRYFLEQNLANQWKHLEDRLVSDNELGVHANWVQLRSKLSSTPGLERATFATEDAIVVQWPTAEWGQGGFYNDVVSSHYGGNPRIPTGCVATAVAIKMRFHEWPRSGSRSHGYRDDWGEERADHFVDFSNETYPWENMPTTDLPAANTDVARLMYHAGVVSEMDYEEDSSSASAVPGAAMDEFFRYKGTTRLDSNHHGPIRDSVLGGLPVIINSSTHALVVDGYRNTFSPYYHINAGWSGVANDWYAFNVLPGGDSTIDQSYPYSAPTNYIYVDANWTGSQNGYIQTPYREIGRGAFLAPTGGHLWLRAGSYSPVSTINKAITIHSYEGVATLNR